MILKIKADDLFSIIMEDSKHTINPEVIEYRRVNSLRNELRMKGILSDLTFRDFNAMQLCFPKNIVVEQTTMTVYKTDRFISHCKCRISSYEPKEREELIEMWRKTI